MKRETGWWGIKLIAESSEDADLLQKVYDSLCNGADDAYPDDLEFSSPSAGPGELTIHI